jgi:hypothetical protein
MPHNDRFARKKKIDAAERPFCQQKKNGEKETAAGAVHVASFLLAVRR